MTQEEGAEIPREQGWRGPLLAFLALLFLPASPPLGLLVPVDQTLVVLAPALAAAAVMGWRAGGRWTLAAVWTAFAFWVVWLPVAGPFALLARGWGVLLAACFGGALAWRGEARFLPRALVAILAALVVGSLVSVASGGLDIAAGLIADDVARRAELAMAALREFTGRAEWVELARDNPAADQLARQVEEQFTLVPRAARQVVPAMLALESLAVLALAWAVYHRFGRARLGPPLAPLRDLRFHDAFVWGLIAGLLVLVVPAPSVVQTFGVNLLVFFGVLFALRGLGVLLWFLAPGRWMLVLWTIVLVMFWSVIGAVALAIGVGDTWLDWRRRPRPKSQRSE